MPLLQSNFRPAWWLRHAHLQTLWPSLSRRKVDIATRRERLELDDGDFIDLHWSGPMEAPVVLILHGLEGSIRSSYVRGMMQALVEQGLQACLMHFRGAGEIPNRLPIAYHSGKTDDPAAVLAHLQTRHAVIGAVGFSLGGNVLLKWLGELGEQSPFQRAAAMSIPFVLDDAAKRLRGGFSRLYERYLIGNLQQNFRRKFSQIPCPLDVDVSKLNTFHQFDDAVTAPLHGFAGVDDYYQRASCRPYLAKIRTPTLILHAKDDPFMFEHTAPRPDELSDQVYLELTEHGGHVGFISGSLPGRTAYWGEQRLARWFRLT